MTSLTLSDTSTRPRLGIRGSDHARWLDANGYSVDRHSNMAYRQSDGSLIARLSDNELIWLASSQEQNESFVQVAEDYRCCTVSRRDSHAWFSVMGNDAPKLFAKVCGIDLSTKAFANYKIAQTSVARISVVIVRADNNEPTYHLLADISYSRYLWNSVVDAASEFGPHIVTLDTS